MALVLTAFLATAQRSRTPVEIRNEIVEVRNEGEDYTIFTYTQKDGTFGYWLGSTPAKN